MASPSRKHHCDSPPYIYSNKLRCRPSLDARIDPTYGQRSAFPGLDGEINGFDDEAGTRDQDEIKALEYLRSVRQEATNIPNVLVAPRSDESLSNYGSDDNPNGYLSKYEDGAFISIGDDALVQDHGFKDDEFEILMKSYDSILLRYRKLRVYLNKPPPDDLVVNLHPNYRVSVGPLNKDLAKWWIRNLKNTDPNPAQVACMNKCTVLRLLGLLAQGTVLKSGLREKMNVSRWIWGLLARLPENGSLTSEEISVLRELGKKAVALSTSLRKEVDWETERQEIEADHDGHEDHQIFDPIDESELQPIPDDFDEVEEIEEIEVENTTTYGQDNDNSVEKTLDEHSVQTLQKSNEAGGDYTSISEKAHVDEVLQNQENQSKIDSPISSADLEDTSEDLFSAKARVLQNLRGVAAEEEPVNLEPEIIASPKFSTTSALDWNTRATIDMILSVIGEIYGQRDLLEFRGHWKNDE